MACFDGPSNENSLDGFLLHVIYHLFVSACSWRRWQECPHNTTHTEPVSRPQKNQERYVRVRKNFEVYAHMDFM